MPQTATDTDNRELLVVLDRVRNSLEQGKRVVRQLPGGGRLMMDRPLPFLCLYRSLPGTMDRGVDELARAQTAYLRYSAAAADVAELRNILATVINGVTPKSKTFLLIELWPTDTSADPDTFTAFCPADNMPSTSEVLDDGLKDLASGIRGAKAEVFNTDQRHPPGLEPLFTVDELRKLGALTIGIAVPPVYRGRDGRMGRLAFRTLRTRFTDVIKRTVYDFVRVQTPLEFPHHLTLGRTTLTRLALSIDRRLVRIANAVDLLFNVSPVNTEQAWQDFVSKGHQKAPDLHYRLIQVDPDLAKRQLFDLRIHEVEDTAMEFILRDKRNELETQLTLLSERGTPQFLYSSLRLHGAVTPALLKKAHAVIAAVDRLQEGRAKRMLDATSFAALVEAELVSYRPQFPGAQLSVRVRNDVDGVLVSKGQVYIGEAFQVEEERAHALIQHEVGTHVVTYFNGGRQPLQLLGAGLAGYDQMQEGLAVLAEYLAGGLDPQRLRLLAARVVAVHAMVQGATFIECFRLLHRELEFPAAHAFRIAVRIFRGGGFVKDAVYLSGLDTLIAHLQRHPADLDLFYQGKFGSNHIRLMQDLNHRGILQPPVLPHFITDATRARIAHFRKGIRLDQLIT